MSRKFVRLSLGGVRDEAEIRGHRRTYIGAMPGRIIQSMKRVGVKNPVFMLDEVDKMNMDFRGDPASALLEVLDPEQNRAFSDHYLEVDFDLHEVFFITTANSDYDIPEPLYDRMEVVNIPGYTAYEKRRIAEEFLIPRQMKESGLTEKDVAFESEGLETLIQRYTREAGVRELERQIASLLRKVARRVIEGAGDETVRLTPKKISELLGPEQYSDLRADAQPEVGLAIGLAWTWAGGDILNIETSIMKGKGEVILTGQLGEVMKESAQAAHTYIRAHSKELGVSERFYTSYDIHLHVPEGAIPKDGPSAGTALAVSMLSALRKQAPEPAIAMTGEITLRGRVLEIGAVKEKILAAKRAGIRTVLLPKDNEKDMADVPEEIRKGVDIQFVSGVGEVFEKSFGDLSNPAKKSASKKSASKKKPAAKRKTPARKKQSSS
jgi:ATP-dependent Lon protease